jgi:hypothetical protein
MGMVFLWELSKGINSMNKYMFILIGMITLTGCVTYPLPDVVLDPMEACGADECKPGNLGVVFNFTKNPYSPDLYESIKPQDIAYSVLGHTIKIKDKTGSNVKACSIDGTTNPFKQNDIDPIGVGIEGRAIEYSKEVKLNIDVTPTVSATLDELKKHIDISAYISELTVKLEAGYKNIENSNSTLTGTYYEYALSDSVIKILHTNQYKECNDFLNNYNRLLITAVGFIEFSTSVKGKEYEQFKGELNALFTAKGINLDVSPILNREVTKTLAASTKNGYQIIVWRKASTDTWAL